MYHPWIGGKVEMFLQQNPVSLSPLQSGSGYWKLRPVLVLLFPRIPAGKGDMSLD